MCDHLFYQLYKLLFCKPSLRPSDEAMIVLSEIGDWYMDEKWTYIIMYGVVMAPHISSKFVPNRLVRREFIIEKFLMV